MCAPGGSNDSNSTPALSLSGWIDIFVAQQSCLRQNPVHADIIYGIYSVAELDLWAHKIDMFTL